MNVLQFIKTSMRNSALVLAFAVLSLGFTLNVVDGPTVGVSTFADENGGGSKGKAYQGPHGMGEKGGDRPDGEVPGKGSGQGGPSDDSDAKGPRYGGGGSTPDETGGKPVWAQEGIPEGDYGRLNVVRAPAHVIDRSLLEAYANLSSNGTDLYTLDSLEALLDAIEAEDAYRVDSPLENLGLLRDLLSDGAIGNDDYPNIITVTDANYLVLAAAFLGSAADKTVKITTDTVDMVTTVLGLELPDGITDQDLADAADQVREAVLTAHEG